MAIGTSPPAPLQDGEGGNKSEKEIPLRSKLASGVIAHQYIRRGDKGVRLLTVTTEKLLEGI